MAASATATIWGELLDRFRSAHPDSFRSWFHDLTVADFAGGVIEIQPGNSHQAIYLQNACVSKFAQIAQAVTGRLVTIRLSPPPAPPSRPQACVASRLNPELTFGRFVISPENRMAQAAAIAVVEEAAHSPLLIIGPEGVGKTHLLQAICHSIGHSAAGSTSIYRRGSDFVADYMAACEADSQDRFRASYEAAAVLVIDDVDELAHRDRSQEELFHIVRNRIDAERQIVLAARQMPADTIGLEQRLASRMSCGLVAAMEQPGFESRIAWLTAEAARLGAAVSPEVIELIASRKKTFGQLRSTLDVLLERSSTRGLPVTAEFALQAIDGGNHIATHRLLETAAARLGVTLEDLTASRRLRRGKLAREIAIHLTHRLGDSSLDALARMFSVSAAELLETTQRVARESSQDAKLAALLDEIVAEAKNAAA